MRRFLRWAGRVLFLALAGALLYALSTVPLPAGPSLYVTEILPLSRATTPPAAVAARPMAEERLSSVEEPPAEETAPPVEGDILSLMFHHLTEDPAATTAWTTTPEKFREDLTKLLDAGYLPLSVEDYIEKNYVRGQDYFIVTFDDGYKSNLTLALPILKELQVPATVFVITGSVDHPEHMTWDEVREITASGWVTVYSHTETHMSANQNTLEAFLKDEHTAWAKIEENIDPAYKVMAYPSGAYTRESMEALAAEGYDLFVIQERPWWFKEENEAGIRILVRHNVEDYADTLTILARNRARNGLPTLAEATALREQRAAEEEAARLKRYASWIEYIKASYEAQAESDTPPLVP